MASTPEGTKGLALVCIGLVLFFVGVYYLAVRDMNLLLPFGLVGFFIMNWGLSLIRKSRTRE